MYMLLQMITYNFYLAQDNNKQAQFHNNTVIHRNSIVIINFIVVTVRNIDVIFVDSNEIQLNIVVIDLIITVKLLIIIVR